MNIRPRSLAIRPWRGATLLLVAAFLVVAAPSASAPAAEGATPPVLPELPVTVPAGGAGEVIAGVDGTVGTATATVEEVTAAVTPKEGSTKPPVAAPNEAGKDVGAVVGRATEGATAATATVTRAVEAATGRAGRGTPAPDPGTTSAPPSASGAEVAEPGGSEEVGAVATSAASPVAEGAGPAAAHQSGGSKPHPAAPPTGSVPPDVAQLRHLTSSVEPALVADVAALGHTLKATVTGAGDAVGTSTGGSGASPSASAPISHGPGGEAHRSLRFADFVPGGTLSGIFLVLVIAVGGLALALAFRRELGIANFRLLRRR